MSMSMSIFIVILNWKLYCTGESGTGYSTYSKVLRQCGSSECEWHGSETVFCRISCFENILIDQKRGCKLRILQIIVKDSDSTEL